MTFGELIDYVLEMSGTIPNDAKLFMETYCNSEWGTTYDMTESIRYDSKDNNVIFSYEPDVSKR